MTTENASLKDILEGLNSHLVMIKSLKNQTAENQYFNLLEKAKNLLGQVHPNMAKFYFQYGSFLLNKVQDSMDLFNPDAVPQAAENIDDYESAYQDEENQQQSGANFQNVETQKIQKNTEQKQQQTEKIQFQNQDVQITQQKIPQGHQQKIQQKIPSPEDQKQEQEDMTDLEVAYENLQAALKIYEKEDEKIQSGEQSLVSQQEPYKYIIMIHIRLGQLYMLDERFQDAIEEYNTIIKLTRGHEKPQMRRKASEAHYNIGNCLLHLNKPNCENQAIKEYIASHIQLLKFIEEKQNYDISGMQLPTQQKCNVDRFGYLYKPLDSDLVKDMKDVMGLLLDKIEDTALQRQQRPNFQKEKQRMNLQKQQSGFKEVSKDVKVTNLGTFGNRKKAQPPSVLKQAANAEKNQNIENTFDKSNLKPVVQDNEEVLQRMQKKEEDLEI